MQQSENQHQPRLLPSRAVSILLAPIDPVHLCGRSCFLSYHSLFFFCLPRSSQGLSASELGRITLFSAGIVFER